MPDWVDLCDVIEQDGAVSVKAVPCWIGFGEIAYDRCLAMGIECEATRLGLA